MIDINKKQSLLALWVPTFQVVNNNIGMLVKMVAIFFLPPLLLNILSGILAPQVPGIDLVFKIFTAIYSFFTGWTFLTVFMRQYAARLQDRVEAFSQSFAAAILPPIFMLIVWLIFSIGLALIMGLFLILRFSIVTTILWAILLVAYLLFVGVRFVYANQAIVLQEKGPVEAIEHSWRLTEGSGYWRALGMCLYLCLAAMLPFLFTAAAVHFVPLYMPVNFASWPWAILLTLALMMLFVYAAFCCLLHVYPIVVFINTDNELHSTEWAKPADMRVVNKHAPSTIKTDDGQAEVKFNGEETIRLSAEEIQSLTVKSTPVAAEGEDENLQAHLDEVFKKAPEGIAQSGDEDRMPTILFDDEMAQQLEENRKMWTKKDDKNSGKKDDNGPESIKMSK